MKRLLVMLALPLLMAASTTPDYARQWAVQLPSADAGAYRIELNAEVYRTLATSDLRDLDVLDSLGNPVAAEVFAPDAPLAAPPTRASVPWFAVQVSNDRDDGALALIAQRDAQGRILSLQAQSTRAATPDEARAFVFDLSAIQGRVEALELALRPDAQVDAAFRVDASEDLQQWRTITPRAQVLSLQQEGRRLARTDVALEQSSRYLRLMPLDGAPALPVLRVDARIASPLKDAPWQWQALHSASSVADAKGFEFDLAGPFPIERVDVESSGNAAIEWRVESRADDGTPWIVRAGPWIAYRVSDKGGAAASAPVEIFGGAVRDRFWRLTAQSGRPTESPTLRLGYRPEVVVFLAQGKPPYALVAGSARARRVDAPLVNLVEAMQQQRGDTWRPAAATLAAGTVLAGDAALEQHMTPQDWRQMLLWGVLVLGALVVGGLALHLLRKGPDAR
jgi:hypothetical protein